LQVLRARGVSKSFGRRRVLENVSLEVKQGEVVGIVGPNGAGKTTLIRILLGILKRDAGEVELMGRDPFKDPRARSRVGAVFERPSLPGALPVREVLEYAADVIGAPRDAVEWAIEASGLRGHEWKRFPELSAGLKQRAALAHALLGRPRLVIADEPTSNLDPVERVKVLDTIAALARGSGVSFLVTSHILHEIVRIADRVVILSSGRVVTSGSIEEVSSRLGRIVRIRTPQPHKLADSLSMAGFKAEVRGLSVIVRLEEVGLKALLQALADIVEEISIYSIDMVEAGLEEVLGGAAV
jgi:ABC-2 type transport system ATP-binding protein